jgi:phosphonopyruvate decarboxylase
MSGALAFTDALAAIAGARTDEVAVLTMSTLALPDQGESDFRLVGQMGAAASIGLGIAIGRPDQAVWVLDGDGSLLMALGVLAAVGDAAPGRFVHVVIANGMYAISGRQPLPAMSDWEQLALGAGYRSARTCSTAAELTAALRADDPGPRMVVVRCTGGVEGLPPGAGAIDPSDESARLRALLARG